MCPIMSFKNQLIFLAVCITIIASDYSVHAKAFSPFYDNYEEVQLSPDFLASWEITSAVDEIIFYLNVKTTGWIRFGLSKTDTKANSDGIVGGVDSGGIDYFHDIHFKTDADTVPTEDTHLDWTFRSSVGEKDGNTTLYFFRNLVTGDNTEDIDILDEGVYILWAFHPTLDDPFTASPVDDPEQSGSYFVNLLRRASTGTTELTTFTAGSRTTDQITQSTIPPIDYFTRSATLSKDVDLTWVVNLQAETVQFILTVKTTGYIGFGISDTGDMSEADLVIGGVSGGVLYFADYFSNDPQKPPILDDLQDWMLNSAYETTRETILVFNRAFDTRDNRQDLKIRYAWTNFVWVLGSTDAIEYPPAITGSYAVNILERPMAATTPTTNHTTTTVEFTTTTKEPTTRMTPPPPEFDFRKEVEITPEFAVQWFVDLRGQRIQFLLQVQATGWMGFGVSVSGSKNYADVIVGGIKDGSYYFDDAHFIYNSPVPMWDDQVDWKFIDGFEYNGMTVLEFWREFNTGDSQDVLIEDTMIDLIWAFHPSDDTPFEISSRHSQTNRGLYRINLLDPTTVSDQVVIHHKPTRFFPA